MTIEEASQLLSDWIQQKPAEVAAQKAAVEHYGKLFRPENVANLTQDQFKAFLLFKNNKHWAGIHRQSNIYADTDPPKDRTPGAAGRSTADSESAGQDHR